MLVKSETYFSNKRKIWMKFIFEGKEFERFFNVVLQSVRVRTFFYEVDDDFPEEMLKLIFGYGAVVVKSSL